MPKTKISEFSATPANNTDIDSINIAEGCAPSGINDAIRELMSQLKDFQTGAQGDSFGGPISGAVNATVGATTPNTGAFTTLTTTSNVGIAVTPSSHSPTGCIDLADGRIISFAANANFATNAYYNGGWKYKTTNVATNYSQTLGEHHWFTAASGTAGNNISFTQVMTLTSDGNLALGSTTANQPLKVAKNGYTTGAGWKDVASITESSGNNGVFLGYPDTSPSNPVGIIGATSTSNASALAFWTFNGSAWGERSRIDSSGNFLVNTTSLSTITGEAAAKAQVAGNFIVGNAVANTNVTAIINGVVSKAGRIGFAESGAIKWLVGNGAASENGVFQIYDNVNGTGVQLSRGATSWSGISDERLKDIIEPITNATNKVSELRAVIGKYKTDEVGTRRSFLIAQDLQKVLPESVDDIDPNKLAVRYTDVIPLLVAAIKEQQVIITQLQADVAALKV